jgi:hypothetical protein
VLRSVLMGGAAGALGMLALHVVGYLDMAIRGRPATDVPAKVIDRVADGIGVDRSAGTPDGRPPQPVARARTTALGELAGIFNGVLLGALYGPLRRVTRGIPVPVAGVAVGAAAMAAYEVPAIAIGATDPARWGVEGWLADVLPHLAYGLVTVAAYDAFTVNDGNPRS